MTASVRQTPTTLPIQLKLTSGWPRIGSDHWSRGFHEIEANTLTSSDRAQAYEQHLRSILESQDQTYEFYEVDALFRKTTEGLQPIKRFFSNLISLDPQSLNVKSVHCHIDVFAYSFLKGAKNFDLFLPYYPQHNVEFEQTYHRWFSEIQALENFERFGAPLEKSQQDNYLKFRHILTRQSARDELRALSCLLLNGPSTIKMISTDLGLNYSLSQRTIRVFEPASIVEHRGNGVYAIASSALPLAIFGLREVLGIDLLSWLLKAE